MHRHLPQASETLRKKTCLRLHVSRSTKTLQIQHCFADESNNKVPRFFSNFLCPTSLGVDAFCHSWENENCWICPPVSKILSVVKKLANTKGRGVLIIPKWTTASFWPYLFPDGEKPIPIFDGTIEFHPNILQNQRARSVLSGKTTFSFLALVYFN